MACQPTLYQLFFLPTSQVTTTYLFIDPTIHPSSFHSLLITTHTLNLFLCDHQAHHHLFFPSPIFLQLKQENNSTPNSIMGFPSVCYCVILPKPLILLVQLLDRLKLAVAMVLYYLGFTSLPEDYAYPLRATDFSVPSSLPSTQSAIKRRIPVVKFSSFCKSCAQGEESTCAVCLGELEARHEVRELGNCCHAFHKGRISGPPGAQWEALAPLSLSPHRLSSWGYGKGRTSPTRRRLLSWRGGKGRTSPSPTRRRPSRHRHRRFDFTVYMTKKKPMIISLV